MAFDPDKHPRGQPGNKGEFAGSAGGDTNQIASSQPTGKNAAHHSYYMQPSVATMQGLTVPGGFESLKPKQQNDINESFKQNMDLYKNADFYPNFRPEDLKGTPQQIAAAVVRHMANNIEYFYNKASDLIRENGLAWYGKVHDLIADQSKQTGIPLASVTGVYAALSPNKNWDINLEIAHRMTDIWATQQDHKFDDLMKKQMPTTLTAKGGAAQTENAKANRAKVREQVMKELPGKSLAEVTDPAMKAWWIRIYDEAHNPLVVDAKGNQTPDSKQMYHIFDPKSPDGMGPIARNIPTRAQAAAGEPGAPSKIVWHSKNMMANAVKCLLANGDPEKISKAIGEQHKVRSFYNDMLAPHSPNQDVTGDTHHTGVALGRPLGSTSIPVAHNFGSNPNSKSGEPPLAGYKPTAGAGAAVTGAQGLYGLQADATRLAAKELGLKDANGLQAVVWEVKRQSFGRLGKGSEPVKAAIDDEWRNYAKGKQSQTETMDKIWDMTQKEIARKDKLGDKSIDDE